MSEMKKMSEEFNDKDNAKTLAYNLNLARKDDKFCDFNLKTTDGIVIPAHKCVLISSSTFFEKIFNNNMKESKSDFVEVQNINGENLKIIVEYMYTGYIKLTEDNVKEILDTAQFLSLQNLVNFCTNFLTKSVRKENFIDLLEYGSRLLDNTLYEFCIEWILKHIDEARGTGNLTQLKVDDVKKLIQLYSTRQICILPSSNQKLHSVILDWIKFDPDERTKYIKDLTKDLRYETMNNEFLLSAEVLENDMLMQNKDFLIKVVEVTKHLLNARIKKHSEEKTRPSKQINSPVKVSLINNPITSTSATPAFSLNSFSLDFNTSTCTSNNTTATTSTFTKPCFGAVSTMSQTNYFGK